MEMFDQLSGCVAPVATVAVDGGISDVLTRIRSTKRAGMDDERAQLSSLARSRDDIHARPRA